jgi:hypothetical protein
VVGGYGGSYGGGELAYSSFTLLRADLIPLAQLTTASSVATVARTAVVSAPPSSLTLSALRQANFSDLSRS